MFIHVGNSLSFMLQGHFFWIWSYFSFPYTLWVLFLLLGGHCLDPLSVEVLNSAVLILSSFLRLLAGILDFAKLWWWQHHSVWIFPDSHQKKEKYSTKKLKQMYPKQWIACPEAQVTKHPQELQNTNGCRQNTSSENKTCKTCAGQSQGGYRVSQTWEQE